MRLFILNIILFFLPFSFELEGQVSASTFKDIIITRDSTICKGESVELKSVSSDNYSWSPAEGLSDSNFSYPIATPLVNTVYYLFSTTRGKNIVDNGDFEGGYDNFLSEYFYTNNGFNPGVFYVGGNLPAWHPAMPPCKDHTSSGGNMLMVNGADVAGVKVWSQTINIIPSTNYEFSCWLQHITTVNPASLQFSINGIPLGNIFRANSTSCIWDRFFATWNSGSATSCEISIINMNTEYSGNDFSLDDISFVPINSVYDSVRIMVENAVIKAIPDTSVCANTTLQLRASGTNTYSWFPSIGLSNSSNANPDATIFNSSASYVVTGVSVNGCKATDTVNIGVLLAPIIKTSNDTAICGNNPVRLNSSGGIFYQWSPITGLDKPDTSSPFAFPLSSTIYHVNVTGSNGCKGADSVTVNVFPAFSIKVSEDTTICVSNSLQLHASGAIKYLWSPGVSLNNASVPNPVAVPRVNTMFKVIATNENNCSVEDSVFVNTLPLPSIIVSNDTAVCRDGLVQLNASGGVSYKWVPGNGLNNMIIPDPIAKPLTSTVYTVSVEGVNGCINKDSVKVELLNAPSLLVSSDTSVCGNSGVLLWAAGANSYFWTPQAGLSDPAVSNPGALPATTTLYKVTGKGVNTCISMDSVLVKVFPAMHINISKDSSVCQNKSAGLFATGGIKYQWTPVTGLSDPNIPNPVATPEITTWYSVKVTDLNNCSESKNVTITVLDAPQIKVNKDTSICIGSSVSLVATGGITYLWSPSEGLNNSTAANTEATPAVSTVYKVTVTGSNNCVNTDSVRVLIKPVPGFGINNYNLAACAGTPIQLTAFGGDRYEWFPHTGLSDPHIANPVAMVSQNQTYSVVITESACKKSETFSVPVTIDTISSLIVMKSNDISCNTPSVRLSANVTGTSYVWSPPGSLSDPTVASPVATPTVNTTYTVSITGINGCKSVGSVEVKAINNNDFRLYQIPNSFTPNGDGKNDCFGVTKWGSVNIVEFLVFNRWGQMVYTGNNSNPCWDGNYKGIPQQGGNFVYKLAVQTNCGIVERKGNVVLIR